MFVWPGAPAPLAVHSTWCWGVVMINVIMMLGLSLLLIILLFCNCLWVIELLPKALNSVCKEYFRTTDTLPCLLLCKLRNALRDVKQTTRCIMQHSCMMPQRPVLMTRPVKPKPKHNLGAPVPRALPQIGFWALA